MASRQPEEEKPLPPGSMGLPWLGETLQFFLKGASFYTEKFHQLGNIYKTHVMGQPTARVTGADNIRTMMDQEPDKVDMKWPTTVNILMGAESLPTVVGPKHPTLKGHLKTGLTPMRLSSYVPCIRQHIQSHLSKWLDAGSRGVYVLGFPACEELIADVMLELVLGCRKEDDLDGKVRAAFKDVNHNLFSVPINIPFTSFNKAVNARKTILDFVQSRMDSGGPDAGHASMMDVLMSLHAPETDKPDPEKVKDNAIGLLLAGAASTAGALTCLLLLLGTHPDVLAKVRDEVKKSGMMDGVTEVTYESVQKLEFVACVVKESLRHLPPVGGCFRKTSSDTTIKDYRIPKDWTVIYSIRDTHTLVSEAISEGDKFKPERWQDQDNQPTKLTTESGTFIPFGAGNRMCLGRHLAQLILQIFVVEIAMAADWTVMNPDSPLVFLPITKPKDDLPLKFKKRASK